MAVAAKKPATQKDAKKQNRKPPPRELMSMPARISEAMAARGLETPADAARASGVGRDIITQIMNKKRLAGMQAANVIRIAKGLRVDAGWLLTGRGSMDGADGSTTIPIISPGSPEFEALANALRKDLSKRR